MFVNSLLESVYGDDFQIDDFDINADEFNIPYIKNESKKELSKGDIEKCLKSITNN